MQEKISRELEKNNQYLSAALCLQKNYDILKHTILIGDRHATYYFIDGFCKDDIMQKLTQFFMEMKAENMPKDADAFLKMALPYPENGKGMLWEDAITQLLSGVVVLFIDGFCEYIFLDARTYPAREVGEPDKDKSLRGSKDGFVETIVCNTALIRRRIRDRHLIIEMKKVGKKSKTDVAVCYLDNKVDPESLRTILQKIDNIKIEALTVNQESLAECLYNAKWMNPFPKFRYTERPDCATAQLMEGSIVIFIDNSPFAMIIPCTLFDILEEADDYYFPPITGSYLRMTRILIGFISYLITPLYLLFVMYPQWLPQSFSFIQIKDTVNVPVIWQFLILELAIDGLRLAAVNTPNMLSTPLSIMAALVLGEFSVNSGWFNAEVMLYMAFVAIATYTQPNYEFGYAVKFMRIFSLILTALFGWVGFFVGIAAFVGALLFNKTVTGKGYLYPLLPFCATALKKRVFRRKISTQIQKSNANKYL